MSLNLAPKSQPPPPKFATGVPQFHGCGVLLCISPGTSRLAKYQTLIPSLVHRLAYTPPPFALNAVPYDVGLPAATPHPLKPPPAPQSVPTTRWPVSPPGPMEGAQEGEVCRVIWLYVFR
jgi:hypothetical protein